MPELCVPRRFNLNENSCKTFAIPVPEGQEVVIAVSKNDVMQNEQIIAGRNEQAI